MTVEKAIEMARAMRQTQMDEAVLKELLTQLEDNLAVTVRRECPGQRCCPSVIERAELAVPSPFDRLYWAYLVAMIDLAAGDAQEYRCSYSLFEQLRGEYARWYQRTGGALHGDL